MGRSPHVVVAVLLLTSGSVRAAPLGATPLEPGLVGRSDIIFFESFEDAAWHSHWKLSSAPQNTSLSSTGFKGQGLRVAVPKDQHYGTSFGFDFVKQGLAEPEKLYFRYYLRFGSSWDGTSGGKLPGFGGTYGVAGWGGKPAHGDDGWSARMTFKAAGAAQTDIGYYVYHADMTGTYGNSWFWTQGPLKNDQWYCIEGYVQLDDPAASNGILRGWVDGQLAYEKTDLNFRTVSSLKVERFWFDIYYGGTWTAPQDMDLFFDNVVVASGRVGCYTTPTPDAGPPDMVLVDGAQATDSAPATDGAVPADAPGLTDAPADQDPTEDAGKSGGGLRGGDGCSCATGRDASPGGLVALALLALLRLRRWSARRGAG